MSLAPGARLGAYEILSLLGAGGMGEVYRARDTRLNRDVAIKVLPEAFVHDADRLARFKREAQVLASLNHPHIGAIYGIEDAAGRSALVLELVDGPTLADRIAQGPIPIDEALPIARQIAEALEAAHEHGVVHRDLKPANIKLTSNGNVKVLDFGLAKAAATASVGPNFSSASRADLSKSPTITSPAMTLGGVILGTAAYMSPEQAKGKSVEKRSDIWAFGCVLYEMLSGKQVFGGQTVTEILAAIVRDEPDWRALPSDTPPAIRRMLRRALEKDPRRRLADAADARLEVEEAHTIEQPVPPAPSNRRWPALASAAIVAALISGSIVWMFARQTGEQADVVTSFGVPLPISTAAAAISRDGRHIVYSANGQLYLRAFDNVDAIAIAGSEGELGNVFLSPDGEWVAYNDFRTGTLKKIRLAGGVPTTISALRDVSSGTVQGSWGTSGTIVLSTAVYAGLVKVPDTSGGLEPISKPASGRHRAPHFLPDGRSLLLHMEVPEKPDMIGVMTLDSGDPKMLMEGRSPHYVTSGHLIFFRDGALWAVGFDVERLEVKGSPVRLREIPAEAFDVSANGTLVRCCRGFDTSISERVLVSVTRAGHEEAIPAPPRGYLYPSVSPDGTRVAVDVRGRTGIGDIWLWDTARQTLAKLTVDARLDTYPVWSADGKYLFFASARDSAANLPNIYRVAVDGAGQVERLTTSPHRQEPLALSPDGKLLVFRNVDPKTGPDLLMRSSDGSVTPLVATQFSERNAAISPDGRWLAYESNDTGEYEIYVRPFPDVNSGRSLVSTSGGTRPVWAGNSRELFYMTANLAGPIAIMSVSLESGEKFRAGTPRRLFAGDYNVPSPGNIGRNYDVSGDGRRFVMTKTEREQNRSSGGEIIVVQNWLQELKAGY